MKLSVIVPTYNVDQYLSKCLDSLVMQTYENFEILIVDDGSIDKSKEIALEYASLFTSIKYLEKTNGGLSDARNYGVHHALGDFVAFIDADDYVDKSMFTKMMGLQEKTGADIVACDMLYIYENGRTEVAIAGEFDTVDVKSNLTFIDMNNSACNKIFRKSLFRDICFPVGKLYEDLFVVPILVYKANKVARVPEPLYMYLQREGSIVHANTLKMFHIYEAICNVKSELMLLSIDENKLQPIINRMLIKHGLFLTTLRIKDNGTFSNKVKFLKLNIEALEQNYKRWYNDISLTEYPVKSRIVFGLLYLRLYQVVALLLKRSR